MLHLVALFNLITSIFFNSQEFVIKTKQCQATDDGLELFAESLRAGKFEKLAKENREKYLSMSPFPHIAFEGAIPPSLIASLQEEMDETKILDNQCYQNATACFLKKGYQYLKSTINDETMMGYHTRMTYSIMRSQLFSNFLTDLTNISNLIPEHTPGGVSYTAPGGYLALHSDYNARPGTGLNRRINCFLFLNDDWHESYGGDLEMWSQDKKQCQARIAPLEGRLVIFTTTDYSWHGQPEPLTAPNGRLRRSIAFYFYTTGARNPEDCSEKNCSILHSTMFVEPEGCKKCANPACENYEDTDDVVNADFYASSKRGASENALVHEETKE